MTLKYRAMMNNEGLCGTRTFQSDRIDHRDLQLPLITGLGLLLHVESESRDTSEFLDQGWGSK